MEKRLNVLVIDDNESIINSVKEYFSGHAVINILDAARTGKEGLDLIINKHSSYDVIIMDVIMPEVDGLLILEEMNKRNINKKIIILSSYKKDYIIKQVSKFNISYYMMKPFSLESLERRILQVVVEDDKIYDELDDSIKLTISKMLHGLGIPSHIKGYQYIREGIYMLYKSEDMMNGITKEIYPEIAEMFETTSSRVERAIRHAIEISWNRGDYDLMDDIFGHSIDYEKAKPTNSEYISALADKLRMDKNFVVA